MIAVTPAPTRTPSTGFAIVANNCANWGRSARGATALSIVDIPINRMPNPEKISAISRVLRFLASIIMITPARTIRKARFFGLSICMNRLPPISPPLSSRRICAVIVVPIFAPKITPTDCRKDIMPAFTKPTTMTVVAEEDWMTMVTTIPISSALNTLPVIFSSVFSSLEPAARSKPFPMVVIP